MPGSKPATVSYHRRTGNRGQTCLPVGLKVIGRVRGSRKPRPLSIADFRLLRTHVVLVQASVSSLHHIYSGNEGTKPVCTVLSLTASLVSLCEAWYRVDIAINVARDFSQVWVTASCPILDNLRHLCERKKEGGKKMEKIDLVCRYLKARQSISKNAGVLADYIENKKNINDLLIIFESLKSPLYIK